MNDFLRRSLLTAGFTILVAIVCCLTSCGTVDRLLRPPPTRQPQALRGPMGSQYDEFDVMRYSIMKNTMQSMAGGEQ